MATTTSVSKSALARRVSRKGAKAQSPGFDLFRFMFICAHMFKMVTAYQSVEKVGFWYVKRRGPWGGRRLILVV
jgi:hypothetical protein